MLAAAAVTTTMMAMEAKRKENVNIALVSAFFTFVCRLCVCVVDRRWKMPN